MGHYIIQTIAFQLLFLMVYDLFLKNETFFNYNRLYLLLTSIFSLIAPFIKLEIFNKIIPNNFTINLPEVLIGSIDNSQVAANNLATDTSFFASVFTLTNIYFFVASLALLFFLFKLNKIVRLIYKSEKEQNNGLTIVYLENTDVAFSFFNFIFLGKSLTETEKRHILSHESIHVKQKHSYDLLWFEILRIIFWFNPLVYFYQNRISNLHEFIADQKAIKLNKSNYYQQLLQQVFNVKNLSFINPFFKNSLIKKRITMLQKSKSKQIKLTKYLLIIPLVFGMLVYTSCQDSKSNYDDIDIATLTEEIKGQIAIQGNISDSEDNALNMLLKTFKGSDIDTQLITDVNQFVNKSSKTKLEDKLATLFDVIQVRGDISDKDENAIKDLLVLTIKDSFDDPYLKDAIKLVEIPYGVVEKTPTYPGCEEATEKENKACFTAAITKHIMTNFNADLADDLGLSSGTKKIYTTFKISKTGKITGLKVRAPHPELDKEAERIINMLPTMTPGSHEGKKVDVTYTLPIAFKVK